MLLFFLLGLCAGRFNLMIMYSNCFYSFPHRADSDIISYFNYIVVCYIIRGDIGYFNPIDITLLVIDMLVCYLKALSSMKLSFAAFVDLII